MNATTQKVNSMQAIADGSKPINASTYKLAVAELASQADLKNDFQGRHMSRANRLIMSLQAVDLLEGRLRPTNLSGDSYPVEGWVRKWSARLPKGYFGEMSYREDVAQVLRIAFLANYSPHCPKGPAACKMQGKRQLVPVVKGGKVVKLSDGSPKLTVRMINRESCELQLMYAFRSAKYAAAQEARQFYNSSGVRRGSMVPFADVALPVDFDGSVADYLQGQGINADSFAIEQGITSQWSDVSMAELKKLLTAGKSEAATADQSRILAALKIADPRETDLLQQYSETGSLRLAAIACGLNTSQAQNILVRYRAKLRRFAAAA